LIDSDVIVYQVTTKKFSANVFVKYGYVIKAASCYRWMLRKNFMDVINEMKEKGYFISCKKVKNNKH